jgi:hypothetical protein
MVLENLIDVAGDRVEASFYGTSGGAEIDLVLTWPDGAEWAVEIKRNPAPKLGRGTRCALADLKPERSFVVYPGSERYKLSAETEASAAADLCDEVMARL